MLTDAELVDGVVAGYDDAFAQLYERHSVAAWRLGQTVTGNADDAADAVSEAFARVLVAVRAGHLDKGGSFRSYLLTATRNAALDNIRKTSRTRPTDQEHLSEYESTSPTPPEHLTHDEEASLVAEAFRNLPERWRSVLWLTEVEGVATKDAAHRLGLTPNGAAQLAVRARTGLRERFLQAHLRKTVEPRCRTTVDRLGAYVGGGLSPRDLAKVDQHLAGCTSCETRRKELEDVGTCLRRAALPVPLALAGSLGAAGTPALFGAGGKVAKAMTWVQEVWVQKAAAAAAAGILAVGAGGAYFAGVDQEQAVPEPSPTLVSGDQAEATALVSTDVAEAGPVFDQAPAVEASPAPPAAPLPVEPAGEVPEAECTVANVGGGSAGGTSLQGQGGASAATQETGGAGHTGPTGGDTDQEPRVAIDSALDRGEGAPEDPPSVEIRGEVPVGEAAARMALTGDMAAGGGVGLDAGLAERAHRAAGCSGGLQAGVGVGGDGAVTPGVGAELPSG